MCKDFHIVNFLSESNNIQQRKFRFWVRPLDTMQNRKYQSSGTIAKKRGEESASTTFPLPPQCTHPPHPGKKYVQLSSKRSALFVGIDRQNPSSADNFTVRTKILVQQMLGNCFNFRIAFLHCLGRRGVRCSGGQKRITYYHPLFFAIVGLD